MAENGRGLATGGGGGFASSAPGSSSPPRIGTLGCSATPSVRPKANYGLRPNRKERHGFSSRSNHGRYRIGRKRSSCRKSRTRPREWGPKVRKFRRTPREYYRPCVREGTRKVGSIERIIGRVSSLSRKNRSESLGRCKNRRSG